MGTGAEGWDRQCRDSWGEVVEGVDVIIRTGCVRGVVDMNRGGFAHFLKRGLR